jgi:hypothetical protein
VKLRVLSVAEGSLLCKGQDPVTGAHFEPGDRIVQCPRCGTPHLTASWKYNDCRCSTFGCNGRGDIQPEATEEPNLVSAALSHTSPVVLSAEALDLSRQSPVHNLARLLQVVYVVGHKLGIILSALILGIVFLADLCAGIPGAPEITIAVGLVIGCLVAMLVATWFAMYFGYALCCKATHVEPIPAIDLVDKDEYKALVILGWIGAFLISVLSVIYIAS